MLTFFGAKIIDFEVQKFTKKFGNSPRQLFRFIEFDRWRQMCTPEIQIWRDHTPEIPNPRKRYFTNIYERSWRSKGNGRVPWLQWLSKRDNRKITRMQALPTPKRKRNGAPLKMWARQETHENHWNLLRRTV